jgi:hypothetical protein
LNRAAKAMPVRKNVQNETAEASASAVLFFLPTRRRRFPKPEKMAFDIENE